MRYYHSHDNAYVPIYNTSASAGESAQLNLSNPPDIPRLFEIARRLEGADIILYYVHNIMTSIIITLALKYSVAAPIRRQLVIVVNVSIVQAQGEGWRDEVVHHAPPPASVPFSIN